MQLPIDVKAVLDEATNIDEASRTPVSVSLYVDESCPTDLLTLVQGAFEAQAPHARVAYCLLEDALRVPFPGDDAAVVVAGLDERVGEAAASLRAVGVPAMVVTTLESMPPDRKLHTGTSETICRWIESRRSHAVFSTVSGYVSVCFRASRVQ